MRMIRCLLFVLIVLLLDRSTNSQSKVYDSGSLDSGATIVDISWRGAFSIGSHREPHGAFSIDIKNTGKKIIKAVDWEFFLVDTVRGDSEYDHFKFRTDDKKIKPGEKKRLTKRFEYHGIPDHVSARARLMRIEFEDGTIWERK
jgi:hypothetical protein